MTTTLPFRSTAIRLLAAAAVALTVTLVPMTAAHAVDQGITGTMTDESGNGLQGAVMVYRQYSDDPDLGTGTYFDWYTDGNTDVDGNYAYDVAPGTYRLQFVPQDPEYATEYWNNAPALNMASNIVVTSGTVKTANAQLGRAGQITGNVTQAAGAASDEYFQVDAFVPDAGAASGYTPIGSAGVDPSTGDYVLSGLPEPEVVVRFGASGSAHYDAEYWNDKKTPQTATKIYVPAGGTVPDVNASLAPWGRITGKVTKSGGAALGGATVTLYHQSENEWVSYNPESGGTDEVQTAGDGTYSLPGPAGAHRVGFSDDQDRGYLAEFWDDAATAESGENVTIQTNGVETPGINAQLSEGGHITGTITQAIGVDGGTVRSYAPDPGVASGWRSRGVTAVDPVTGKYDVHGLATGSYRLRFKVPGFQKEFWENSTQFGVPTPIAVTAPSTVSNVSPTLTALGHIEGAVTSSAGAPVRGAVFGFRKVDLASGGVRWVMSGEAEIDAEGHYDFASRAGTYRLKFDTYDDTDGDYHRNATEYYNNSKNLDGAQSITVSSGGHATGKDVQVVPGAVLTGTLTMPDGVDYDEGTVTIYDDVSDQVVAMSGYYYENFEGTGSSTWSVDDLMAGSYRVEFNRLSGGSLGSPVYDAALDVRSGYPSQFEAQRYSGKAESLGTFNVVTVAAGAIKGGINATMKVGGRITGTLVGGSGAPLADCQVQARSATGSLVTRSTWTDESGGFTIQGLSTGDYQVSLLKSGACDHSEFYTAANGDLSTTNSGLLAVHTSPGSTTELPTPLHFGTTLGLPSVSNSVTPSVPAAAPTVGVPVAANGGTWSPAPVVLAYQWRAGGTDISGATSSSYTPVVGDLGKALSVRVTGSKAGYNSGSVLSNATGGVVAGSVSVTNSVLPTVPSAPAVVGTSIVAMKGSWAPDPVLLAYQWQANGADITGATALTYTPVVGDAGKTLALKVTGSKGGYLSKTVTSNSTSPVLVPVANSTLPKVTGTARVGKTLTADKGVWVPGDAVLSVQWLRDGVEVRNATGDTYVLKGIDAGHAISIRVAATRAGLAPRSETSHRTAKVAPGVITLRSAASVAGKLKVGKLLTAVAPRCSPSPVAVTYRWLRNGKKITGATKSTYKLKRADKRAKVSVRMVVRKVGYSDVAVVASKKGRVK